jgi:small nuclear ribonucleoprotein (snRNP)-like protein
LAYYWAKRPRSPCLAASFADPSPYPAPYPSASPRQDAIGVRRGVEQALCEREAEGDGEYGAHGPRRKPHLLWFVHLTDVIALRVRQLPLSLLKTAQGHPMLVELKNGDTYNGRLVSCDTWMNINLRDVICTSRVSGRQRLDLNWWKRALVQPLLMPHEGVVSCFAALLGTSTTDSRTRL